jgi:ribonucleoside-diphosphate reductase alpha chain
VPFIKIYEATIKAFNQLGKRPGSVAIYFPWWHYEAPELIMLRDAGGTDDTRARANKYAIKLDEVIFEKAIKDEEVYLFDPKETPELLDTYGEEFKEIYEYYSNKNGIKKRKVKARELYFKAIKVFIETGHLYRFFVDNANKFRASRDFINQGNLCCSEVLLPTKPLKFLGTKLIKNMDTGEIKEIREYDGEIGVCNLTSIDCVQFWNMSDEEKEKLLYSVALGIDNAIEYGTYPVKAGEKFNKTHRAIGIGITNYQQWLASLGYSMEDEGAREVTHQLMEDLHYFTLKASVELAKERGHYDLFEWSLWEQGILPFELYEKHFDEVEKELNIKLNFKYRRDWDNLRKEIQEYGVRFEFHNSIPPGATSSLVLNFTEGIEPLQDLIVEREGTFNVKKLAPNINKYRQFYKNVFDIDYEKLLILAAIRQKFLDQSQSLNVYIKDPDSAYQVFKIDYLAHKLGLKSLYYAKNNKKQGEEQVCEGCAL